MNNTIDFNTAKTIDTMSKKIDHIDDTVSGFFSFMHMVMQNELGNAEPYFAAVSPVLDLTVIRPDDAPHILPCFDEADEGIGISEDEPLGFRYNPKQVIKLMGKRYLIGPVIFHPVHDILPAGGALPAEPRVRRLNQAFHISLILLSNKAEPVFPALERQALCLLWRVL